MQIIDTQQAMSMQETTIAELRQDIQAMKAHIEQLTDKIANQATKIAGWNLFWRTVNDRIIEEADTRGWCDQFDAIIEEIAQDAPAWVEVERRETEVEVEFTAQVNGPVSRTITLIVRGKPDEDDLRDRVKDWIDTHGLDLGDMNQYEMMVDDVVIDHFSH